MHPDCKQIVNKLCREQRKIFDENFTFDSNSIHNQESINFYRDILEASDNVLDILKHGYMPTFKKDENGQEILPPAYFERNNKSCVGFDEVICNNIQEWLDCGKISEVESTPFICSPLSLVSKQTIEGETKYRLCLDLSRHLNNYLEDFHCKLDTIELALELLDRNAYMSSWDLRSMYTQVRLNPRARTYFGFNFKFKGKNRFFVYNVLPFGVGPAVFLVNILTRPIKAYLHTKGILALSYIDDNFIYHVCIVVALFIAKFALSIFLFGGWLINWEKSALIPAQRLYYLGFFIDSKEMIVEAPKMKLDKTKNAIRNTIFHGEKNIPLSCKNLAKALGLVCSLKVSHGDFILSATRFSQNILGQITHRSGWDSSLNLSSEAIRELRNCLRIIDKYNKSSFDQRATVILTSEHNIVLDNLKQNLDDVLLLELKKNFSPQSFILTYEQKVTLLEEPDFESLCTGVTELIRLKNVINTFDLNSIRNKKLLWLSQTNVLDFMIKRGSKIPMVQSILLEIHEKLLDFNILLISSWQPLYTTLEDTTYISNKLCRSTDEWSIDHFSFLEIQSKFKTKITVDCFSTLCNRKAEKFWSLFPHPESSGVDFFLQKLKPDQVYYVTPPVSQISQAILKILSYEHVNCILIVPFWTHWPFFALFSDDDFGAPFVKNLFRFKPRFIQANQHSIFHGHTIFDMLAVHIFKPGSFKVPIPLKTQYTSR